jgi:hypothetical protein
MDNVILFVNYCILIITLLKYLKSVKILDIHKDFDIVLN